MPRQTWLICQAWSICARNKESVMLRRLLTLAPLMSLVCAFAISGTARAQNPPFGGNANMVTEFRGQLKGFQRGIVNVLREDGTEVMVQLPESLSSFQFVATAKPAFLQRGSLVRFQGTFTPNGIPLEPVTRVELFQPVAGKMAGHMREQYVPGIYPERQNENPQALPTAVKCGVVGALMGIDGNGVMVVQAGNRPIRVPLSGDVKFEIRYNNLSLAQEGDPVSVAGFYQPPDETKVKAERITVTTDRIYGEPSDEPPKRVSRRRSRRDTKEEPAEPASDQPQAQEKPEPESENKEAAGKEGDAAAVEA